MGRRGKVAIRKGSRCGRPRLDHDHDEMGLRGSGVACSGFCTLAAFRPFCAPFVNALCSRSTTSFELTPPLSQLCCPAAPSIC